MILQPIISTATMNSLVVVMRVEVGERREVRWLLFKVLLCFVE